MTTKTIKIEIPKGFELGTINQATGEIQLKEKPKDIKERIQSFDDVLRYHDIDQATIDQANKSLESDEIAYRQVKLIVSALNEGWVPDWEDSSEYKYYPWFNMGSPSGVGFSYCVFDYWCSDSGCGSRLCFKTAASVRHVAKEFLELYKSYYVI